MISPTILLLFFSFFFSQINVTITTSLFLNSSGVFSNNLSIFTASSSSSLMLFLSSFPSATINLNLQIDFIQIQNPFVVSNNFTMDCISALKCDMIFLNNGMIEINEGGSFSMHNFNLMTKEPITSTLMFFIYQNSDISINMTNFVNSSSSMRYFCYSLGESRAKFQNLRIENSNQSFDDFFLFFYGEGANFTFYDLTFFGNNFSNVFLLQTKTSTTTLKNFNFSHNIIKTTTEYDALISFSHSILLDTVFVENNLFNVALISLMKDEESSGDLKILNSKFNNNRGLKESNTIILLKILENIKTISIYSVLIMRHTSITPIIDVSHVNTLIFNETDFIENESENLIFLADIGVIQFEKTLFKNNNHNSMLEKLGSCLKILVYQYISIKDCLVRDNFGNVNTPGIYISSINSFNEKIDVFASIFINNQFIYDDFVESYGCVFSINSYSNILFNQTYFKSNVLSLPIEANGGVSLYFYHFKINIQIVSSQFENNTSEKSGLILEGRAENISIFSSIFIENTPTTDDLTIPSMSVIRGSTMFFTMLNCYLINNIASFGIFYFTEIKVPLTIEMNNVSLYYNFGGNAAGICTGQETNNRTIIWRNSDFKGNSANGVATFLFVYILHRIQSLNFLFENLRIADNWNSNLNALAASWCLINNPVIVYRNCLFKNNRFDLVYAKNDIGAIINGAGLSTGYRIFVENSTFDTNYFYNSWAVIFNVQNYIKNVVFTNNSCVLTGLFYFHTSYFEGENVTLTSNDISYIDFITFNHYSSGKMTNMTFIGNNAGRTTISSYKSNSLILKDVKIINMTLGYDRLFFYFKSSTVNLMENITIISIECDKFLYGETTFVNLTRLSIFQSVITTILYFSKQSRVFLNGTTFSEGFIDSNFKRNSVYMKDSYFSVNSFEFESNSVNNFQKFNLISCVFMLKDSVISHVHSSRTKYLFFLTTCQVFLQNSSFLNSTNIFECSKTNINVSFSNFSDFNATKLYFNDPFIICLQCSSFIIKNCFFCNLATNSSIFSLSGSFSNQFFYFVNNSFNSNICSNCTGGCISVSNLRVSFIGNIFSQNQAKYGGGIYLKCTQDSVNQCEFNLSNNSFINNHASIAGGALKWEILPPSLFNNTFSNNTATFGNDITSFFCRLGLKLVNSTGSVIFDSFSNYPETAPFFILQGIKPNLPIPYALFIYPLDSYNQFIKEKIHTNIEISFLFPSDMKFIETHFKNLTLNDNFYCENSTTPRIVGSISLVQSSDFDFSTDLLQIIACPTSLINLNFFAQGLPKYNTSIYSEISSENEILTSNSYLLILSILLDDCKIGEVYDKNRQICTVCPSNTYTFDPKDASCHLCPAHANCSGSEVIKLDRNYWRSSKFSLDIQICDPYVGNCLGGENSSCDENYQGILCSVCSRPNFDKDNWGDCNECSKDSSYIFKTVGYDILLIFGLFMICSVFVSQKTKDVHRFLLKLLMKYSHFLTANYSLHLNVSFEPLKNYLLLFHNPTNLDFWISFFCFPFKENTFLESFFVIITVYLFFLFIFVLVRLIYNLKMALRAIFVLFYFVSPMVFSYLISSIYCREIDGIFLLNQDPSVICWGETHIIWISCFFAPNLVIFFVLAPLQIYKCLDSPSKSLKYDFLFIYQLGYTKFNCNYDIVVYLRNCLMIIVCFLQIDENFKVCANLFILTYSLANEIRLNIYLNHQFETIGTLLNLIFIIDNYLLIYATSQNNNDNHFYVVILPILIILHSAFMFLCFSLLFRRDSIRIFVKRVVLRKKSQTKIHFSKKRNKRHRL